LAVASDFVPELVLALAGLEVDVLALEADEEELLLLLPQPAIPSTPMQQKSVTGVVNRRIM
jgi:hypothetical protein